MHFIIGPRSGIQTHASGASGKYGDRDTRYNHIFGVLRLARVDFLQKKRPFCILAYTDGRPNGTAIRLKFNKEAFRAAICAALPKTLRQVCVELRWVALFKLDQIKDKTFQPDVSMCPNSFTSQVSTLYMPS